MPKPNETKPSTSNSADAGAQGSDKAAQEARPLDELVVEQPQGGGSYQRCSVSGVLSRVESEPAPSAD